MFSRKFSAVVLVVAACCLLLAGPVLASPSYFVSFDIWRATSTVPEGHYVKICDENRDGYNAYARYNATGGTGTVEAINGAGTCNSTNWKSLVNWHEACYSGCEDRSYH